MSRSTLHLTPRAFTVAPPSPPSQEVQHGPVDANELSLLFESGTSFGGVWADAPTNDVVYNNLRTNLPTCVMQSPDLDFGRGLPSYVTKPQLGAYIERYANTFGVSPLARFNNTVTSVTPAPSCG